MISLVLATRLSKAVIATVDGIPVELTITSGHMHDSEGMRHLSFYLPSGSKIYADSAYTDYQHEDDLAQAMGITLLVARKSTRGENVNLGRSYLPLP